MTPEQIAIKTFMARGEPIASACCCMGPTGGEPLCPCAMDWVVKVDNVYYKIEKEPLEYGYQYVAKKLDVPQKQLDVPQKQQTPINLEEPKCLHTGGSVCGFYSDCYCGDMRGIPGK